MQLLLLPLCQRVLLLFFAHPSGERFDMRTIALLGYVHNESQDHCGRKSKRR